MQYKHTFANSIYGDNPIGVLQGKVLSHKTEALANASIAPTIRVDGVLMGTDKWGHFFAQGYWYYENNLNAADRKQFGLYLEGDKKGFYGNEKPEPKVVEKRNQEMKDKITKSGKDSGFGSLGANTSGVISYSDIAANEEGYKFYRDLAANYKTFTFKLSDYNLTEFNENNGATKPDRMRIKLVNGVTVNLNK